LERRGGRGTKRHRLSTRNSGKKKKGGKKVVKGLHVKLSTVSETTGREREQPKTRRGAQKIAHDLRECSRWCDLRLECEEARGKRVEKKKRKWIMAFKRNRRPTLVSQKAAGIPRDRRSGRRFPSKDGGRGKKFQDQPGPLVQQHRFGSINRGRNKGGRERIGTFEKGENQRFRGKRGRGVGQGKDSKYGERGRSSRARAIFLQVFRGEEIRATGVPYQIRNF